MQPGSSGSSPTRLKSFKRQRKTTEKFEESGLGSSRGIVTANESVSVSAASVSASATISSIPAQMNPPPRLKIKALTKTTTAETSTQDLVVQQQQQRQQQQQQQQPASLLEQPVSRPKNILKFSAAPPKVSLAVSAPVIEAKKVDDPRPLLSGLSKDAERLLKAAVERTFGLGLQPVLLTEGKDYRRSEGEQAIETFQGSVFAKIKASEGTLAKIISDYMVTSSTPPPSVSSSSTSSMLPSSSSSSSLSSRPKRPSAESNLQKVSSAQLIFAASTLNPSAFLVNAISNATTSAAAHAALAAEAKSSSAAKVISVSSLFDAKEIKEWMKTRKLDEATVALLCGVQPLLLHAFLNSSSSEDARNSSNTVQLSSSTSFAAAQLAILQRRPFAEVEEALMQLVSEDLAMSVWEKSVVEEKSLASEKSKKGMSDALDKETSINPCEKILAYDLWGHPVCAIDLGGTPSSSSVSTRVRRFIQPPSLPELSMSSSAMAVPRLSISLKTKTLLEKTFAKTLLQHSSLSGGFNPHSILVQSIPEYFLPSKQVHTQAELAGIEPASRRRAKKDRAIDQEDIDQDRSESTIHTFQSVVFESRRLMDLLGHKGAVGSDSKYKSTISNRGFMNFSKVEEEIRVGFSALFKGIADDFNNTLQAISLSGVDTRGSSSTESKLVASAVLSFQLSTAIVVELSSAILTGTIAALNSRDSTNDIGGRPRTHSRGAGNLGLWLHRLLLWDLLIDSLLLCEWAQATCASLLAAEVKLVFEKNLSEWFLQSTQDIVSERTLVTSIIEHSKTNADSAVLLSKILPKPDAPVTNAPSSLPIMRALVRSSESLVQPSGPLSSFQSIISHFNIVQDVCEVLQAISYKLSAFIGDNESLLASFTLEMAQQQAADVHRIKEKIKAKPKPVSMQPLGPTRSGVTSAFTLESKDADSNDNSEEDTNNDKDNTDIIPPPVPHGLLDMNNCFPPGARVWIFSLQLAGVVISYKYDKRNADGVCYFVQFVNPSGKTRLLRSPHRNLNWMGPGDMVPEESMLESTTFAHEVRPLPLKESYQVESKKGKYGSAKGKNGRARVRNAADWAYTGDMSLVTFPVGTVVKLSYSSSGTAAVNFVVQRVCKDPGRKIGANDGTGLYYIIRALGHEADLAVDPAEIEKVVGAELVKVDFNGDEGEKNCEEDYVKKGTSEKGFIDEDDEEDPKEGKDDDYLDEKEEKEEEDGEDDDDKEGEEEEEEEEEEREVEGEDDNEEEGEEPAPKKRFVDKKSVRLAKGAIGPVAVAAASTSSSNSLQDLQTKKRTEEDVPFEDSSSSLDLDSFSLAQVKPNVADKPAEMKIESSLDYIVDRQRITLAGQVLKAHKEGLAPPGRFIGPIDVVAALTHLLHRAPFPLTSFC